ncbi:MAG: pilus assembly protein PilM [Abditibacteriota bacterium]|nr:pilus assembly protein PilM [Abditibacteriota bacterium]
MSKENTVLKGSMVGIDIGNDTVKIAEVKADGKALQITGLASQALPAGAVTGEAIQNVKEIGQIIKEMVKASGISSRKCVVSYTGSNRVMSKIFDVPRSDKEKAVTASVRYEVERVFPFGAGDTEMSYAEVPADDIEPTAMRTYVTAAHRALVQGLLDVVLAAGLTPVAIETSGLAAGRSLIPMSADDSKITAILNIGAQKTEMSIFAGTSVISPAYSFECCGSTLTDAVAEAMEVDFAQAEEAKRNLAYIDINQIEEFLDKEEEDVSFEEGEFDTPFDDPDYNPLISGEADDDIGEDFSFDQGFDTDFTEGGEEEYYADPNTSEPEETPAEEVQPEAGFEGQDGEAGEEREEFAFDGSASDSEKVLMAILPRLLDLSREVRVQLEDYYSTTNKVVDKLVITGGTAGIHGLELMFGRQVGLECVKADISANYTVASNAGGNINGLNTVYPVAIGLATRDLVE